MSFTLMTQADGDYTAFITLLNGLPNGTRVKALAFWAKEFSNSKMIFTVVMPSLRISVKAA